MQLSSFNALPNQEAAALLHDCCAADRWVKAMVGQRPFDDIDAVMSMADTVWSKMTEPDWLMAFDAHPKIGDPDSLKQKYARTHSLASDEQSGVQSASDEVIEALAAENDAYLKKFGFIFIVCATGKTAAEMLALVRARLPNSREQELQNAAVEQGLITAIRIRKLFAESS